MCVRFNSFFDFETLHYIFDVFLLEFANFSACIVFGLVILPEDGDQAGHVQMRVGYISLLLVQDVLHIVGEHELVELTESFELVEQLGVEGEVFHEVLVDEDEVLLQVVNSEQIELLALLEVLPIELSYEPNPGVCHLFAGWVIGPS